MNPRRVLPPFASGPGSPVSFTRYGPAFSGSAGSMIHCTMPRKVS